MFCKSGILIFIFAENNYFVRRYIYPHHVIKTPLLHQSSGPLSLSLFFQADPLELRGPLSSLSCLGF